jgi:hypothetical protein
MAYRKVYGECRFKVLPMDPSPIIDVSFRVSAEQMKEAVDLCEEKGYTIGWSVTIKLNDLIAAVIGYDAIFTYELSELERGRMIETNKAATTRPFNIFPLDR